MKKVLNWVIGAILVIYGVMVTVGTYITAKENEELREQIKNERARGNRVRESLRKRYREKQCKTSTDYLNVTGDICSEIQLASGDELDELCEEFWVGKLVYNAVWKKEVEWLNW